MRAANLLGTGERYAYAVSLLVDILASGVEVTQVHIDIMCKWKPWAVNLMQRLHELPRPLTRWQAAVLAVQAQWQQMRMVNSAAHGNLHAQSCQVCRSC